MSGAQLQPGGAQPGEAQPGAGQTGGAPPVGADPSMEDILASIRRILSEEDVPPAPPGQEAEQDQEVFLLDSSMLVADAISPPVTETAVPRPPMVPPAVSPPPILAPQRVALGEAAPAEAAPFEAPPAEMTGTEAAPIEAMQDDATPAETAPIDVTPAEAKSIPEWAPEEGILVTAPSGTQAVSDGTANTTVDQEPPAAPEFGADRGEPPIPLPPVQSPAPPLALEMGQLTQAEAVPAPAPASLAANEPPAAVVAEARPAAPPAIGTSPSSFGLPTSRVLVPVPRPDQSAPSFIGLAGSVTTDLASMTAPPPGPSTSSAAAQADPAPHAPAAVTPQSESSPMSASISSAGLTSAETANAAAGSVTNLVRALTSDRGTQVHSGGPTIADLVREELRPMLKAWLDSNLPPLVERLVSAEIERVIARASV